MATTETKKMATNNAMKKLLQELPRKENEDNHLLKISILIFLLFHCCTMQIVDGMLLNLKILANEMPKQC